MARSPRHARLSAATITLALAAGSLGGVVAASGDTTVPAETVPAEVALLPLTGLPEPDGWVPRAVIAVKVDNHPQARPQAGLNQADIVFEEIVEGSLTRFAAVFNSTDADVVGPVRSGRTQDVGLLSSFERPVLAYSGANGGVQAALNDTDFTLVTEGNGAFFRDNPNGADREHTLWLRLSELFPQVGDNPAPAPQFQYRGLGDTSEGTPVAHADVQLAGITAGWIWDEAAGVWLRSQNGNEHQLRDGRASTDNVVILTVPYGRSAADSGSPEAQVVGGGTAQVLTDGVLVEGSWHRASHDDPFVLTAADGSPILLSPGRAWVELASEGGDGATFS